MKRREGDRVRALSVSTLETDPYRAGDKLVTGLGSFRPEVVFLFSSVHYDDFDELLEAIYDRLGPEVLLLGATGDGFYESDRGSEFGAAMLALDSEGKARWSLSHATGLRGEPEAAARHCIETVQESLGPGNAKLIFLVADCRHDASRSIAEVVRRATAPVVGGLGGDDRHLQRGFVFANRTASPDMMVALGVAGDVPFEIHTIAEMAPLGETGVVTAATGTRLDAIDGSPATRFVERATGKQVTPADRGIATLRVIDPRHPEVSYLRAVAEVDHKRGTLGLVGSVAPGDTVQVCRVDARVIRQEFGLIGDRIRNSELAPKAGVFINCAGRRWVLGTTHSDEVASVFANIGERFPMTGFASWGEIGPRRCAEGYTRTMFHNETLIVLVFG